MNVFALLGLIAAAAVVLALVSGMTAMATDGEVRHHGSAEWMELRVLLQASAVLCIVLAVVLGPSG